MTREQQEDKALAAADLQRDTPRGQVALVLIEHARVLYGERRRRWEAAPPPKARRERVDQLAELLGKAAEILRDAGSGDPFARGDEPFSAPLATMVGRRVRLPYGETLVGLGNDPTMLPAIVAAVRDAAAELAEAMDDAEPPARLGRPTAGARDEALRQLGAVFACVHVREDARGRGKHRDDFVRAAGRVVVGDVPAAVGNILAGAHEPVGLSERPSPDADGVLDFNAHEALTAFESREAFGRAADVLRPLASRLGRHSVLVTSRWVRD